MAACEVRGQSPDSTNPYCFHVNPGEADTVTPIFVTLAPAIDPPVLSYGGAVIAPSFTRPMLSASQPLVTAGTTLQVSGNYFSLDNPVLGFQQPGGPQCLGGYTELEWGPPGGQTQRQQLSAGSDGTCPISFDGTNLNPSTAYQFRARNCDALTCSVWSAPFNASTSAGVSNTVTLTLDVGGASPAGAGCSTGIISTRICSSNIGSQVLRTNISIGTATLTSQGTFSTTVTIPAGTAAGSHTIHAAAGDAQADASIQVTAATGTAGGNATLVMVGLLANEKGCPPHILTSTQTDATFLLFGNGFAPGTVTINLDSATGTPLGTATADANGSFCQQLQGVPGSQAGPHKLVAVQNGTVQAEDTVTFVTPSVVR